MQRTCAVSTLIAVTAASLSCASSVASEASSGIAGATAPFGDSEEADASRSTRGVETELEAAAGWATGELPFVRRVAARSQRQELDEKPGSMVVSSAEADDGSRYVAGVFSGTLIIGAVVLKSHGGDDIFVARVRPDGTVAWARAIGSERDESDPNVSFSDGRVKLVAMTDGAVDCGQGPLATWSTESFFLCTFGVDGATINGGTFPTGRR